MDTIAVILPAKLLPDGTRVTKTGGTKVYRLMRSLRFYAYGQDAVIPKDMTAPAGHVFLVSEDGNNNVTHDKMNLKALVERDSFSFFLNQVDKQAEAIKEEAQEKEVAVDEDSSEAEAFDLICYILYCCLEHSQDPQGWGDLRNRSSEFAYTHSHVSYICTCIWYRATGYEDMSAEYFVPLLDSFKRPNCYKSFKLWDVQEKVKELLYGEG